MELNVTDKTRLFRAATGILIVICLSLIASSIATADSLPQTAETDQVVVYLFWGEGCPHCAKAKPFLENLSREYPQVEVMDFEVYYVMENRVLLAEMAAAFDFEARAVPTIFVGERYWEGFSDQLGQTIETYVVDCLQSGCPDPGRDIIPGREVEQPTPVPEVTPSQAAAALEATAIPQEVAETDTATGSAPDTGSSNEEWVEASNVIDVPLLGAVNLSGHSLTVATTLIAFVDGFNPCSLWVLSILMALTLHTGSRKKVLVIGLVFITVTAAVYVLFIAGLFTVLTVVSFLGWIQVVVALVALFFALVNIKDYFWYKEGISFTIADDKKPGIYQRARHVLNASDSLWGMIGATVVMAAGVSLVEFSCTAGFPVLWTNLLTAQNVGAGTFALLLLLYMLIYQIDELAIFMVAVLTLKASRLEEKHGRILKLVGGMLMLTLVVVMIVEPALMNNLSNSLLIFGAAFAGALIVLLVHRQILPRLGVQIGTEMSVKRSLKGRQRKKPA
jgi:thiol-disulfide isomerase/thioredoxin